MTRIIFFSFVGRKANMEIQRPYIEHLLDVYPTAELHLWDLTRTEDDQLYARMWAAAHEQIAFVGHLHPGHPLDCAGDWRGPGHRRCQCIKHKPPYEAVYRYYRDERDYADDTVFVKFDDDVIWMDVSEFGEVLAFLETEPGAIASANVVNNVVCAKYEPDLVDSVQSVFDVGNPEDPANDREWWALHTNAAFANMSHAWLGNVLNGDDDDWPGDRDPMRTRLGEAISINFIAMYYPMLKVAANRMDDVERGMIGDEAAIDSFRPWIIPNFRVAHLSFGPQEHDLDPEIVAAIREQYKTEGVN
jgi:hypothetical protein